MPTSPGNPAKITMDQAVSHAVETVRISRLARPYGVILLAIGGLTAAGKTHLAREFQKTLRAKGDRAWVLEGDRFILPKTRRPAGERYPEDVYELSRLGRAIEGLASGRSFLAPFYHKMERATGRLRVPPGYEGGGGVRHLGDYRLSDAASIIGRHLDRLAHSGSRLWVDTETLDLVEEVPPNDDVWIFDSEIALAYPEFRRFYDGSYAVWAPRERRKRNFLDAVRRGERYPVLSEQEAIEKVEGFFLEDDRFNTSFLGHAQVWVDNT